MSYVTYLINSLFQVNEIKKLKKLKKKGITISQYYTKLTHNKININLDVKNDIILEKQQTKAYDKV